MLRYFTILLLLIITINGYMWNTIANDVFITWRSNNTCHQTGKVEQDLESNAVLLLLW